MLKVNVIMAKDAPVLKNPEILQGIRDRAGAETWGMKNGFSTVYFIARKQRVYAERLLKRVDQQAKQIEMASKQLTLREEAVS